MSTIIRQQWGSHIICDRPVKEEHVKGALSKVPDNYKSNEVFIKYEVNYNGDQNSIAVFGYGLRDDETVSKFMREFRKHMRPYGYYLNGNIWLYGEKEILLDKLQEQIKRDI